MATALPAYASRALPAYTPRALSSNTGHWFTRVAKPLTPAIVAPLSGAPMVAGRRALSTPAAESPAESPAPSRFVTTCEVIVSKIFPAGFGWQAASVVAGNQGMEADTLSFALTTGAGDFAGVFAGHTSYSLAKYMVTGKGGPDPVTGLWLASAAFCSGTAWQPTVNFLHDAAGTSFLPTVVGCGTVTGMCFFAGLRLGRLVYAPLGLEASNYSNLCGDALLSCSIGAATGTFVGTDVTFSDNFLRPFFGVEDSMSDVEGMVRAGCSTSTGFLFLQTAQNLALPKNANWLDPVVIGAPEPEPAEAKAKEEVLGDAAVA
jgi:hypothetical protein